MTDAHPSLAEPQPSALTRISRFIIEALVNFAAPFAIYTLARDRLGDAHALMAAAAPPLAWSIIEFVRRRRIDALSMIVLAGIALSLVAFFGGGGVKALQLRETLVGGAIGVIFLASAAIGRPLIFYLARATIARRSPARTARFAAVKDSPAFRRAMMTMTLAWGFGLALECAAGVALVYVLTIQQYLLAGPILGYSFIGLLTLWTFWFARRRLAPMLAD